MKRFFTFLFAVSLLSITTWAADVSLTETFSSINQTSSVASDTWAGDVCTWTTSFTRHKQPNWSDSNYGDYINVGGSADDKMPCCWMSSNGSTQVGSISSTNLEGGIKAVSFLWAQFGAEASNTLKLKISAGTTEDFSEEKTGGTGANRTTGGSLYTHTFANKTNCQLTISNASTKGGNNACRILVGDITITPYLLYTTKEVEFQITGSSNKYTNNDLINNTDENNVVYSISTNEIGATIDAYTGEVTATEAGVVTVTASWEDIETSYQLTILSKNTTTASFASSKLLVDIAGEVVNPLSKNSTADAAYASSNGNVAIVDAVSGAVTIKGVGIATISATIPENNNYLAGEASYMLIIRDNNALKEAFSSVSQPKAVGDTKVTWEGDLFDWEAQYSVRRGANDTIGGPGIQGTWVGTGDPGVLNSKEEVEGGIKYLSFFWKQWATENSRTMRLGIYAGEILKDSIEFVPAGATTHENFYFATNAFMQSNAKLKIVNQSYTGTSYATGTVTTSNSRFVIDSIYITPYLLYTNKAHDLYAGESYTMPIFDNTEEGTITYSLEDNDDEASIDPASGEVTALKAGEVTVKATWSEGAYTTYRLTILSKVVTVASFAESVKRVDLNTLAIFNTLNVTEGYDGTITYESSNTAVATVDNGNVSITGGVGQATITATLPATDNYEATSASYIIYVRDNAARIEAFTGITGGVPTDSDLHDWGGDLFMWQRQYQVRRSGNDTIYAGTDKHQATSIGVSNSPSAPSILQSKVPIEGGIKYLSFYWAQWGAAGEYTRRIAVYAGETLIGAGEHAGGANGDELMLGVNNAMKSNKQLIIKNESYKGTVETLADNACRIVLDNIYITPYLLYTDKTKRSMHIGTTDKNESLVNNTGGNASYESSNTAVATVAADGTVTAIGRGTATITASYQWSENEIVTTWYEVEVYPVNCETFDGIEQTSNYGNTTPREGDKATWSTSLGGFNAGDLAALTTNLVRFRAPMNADEKAYIESSAIEGGIASMTFDWNIGGAEGSTEWDIRIFINGREVKRLNNENISATNAMDHFEQIAINDINEPGNFSIRFENHSTIGGTYPTNNKARFLIDNIIWTNYAGTKTLSENADNSDWIRNNAGETRNVIISRSDLVANVWNTLCLPFAISRTTDLNGAAVQQLNDASLDGNSLSITFSTLVGDELTAGTPYLVMPDVSNINISGTYENKSIAIVASQVEGPVTMQGIYSPTLLKKDDYSTLFVGTPDGEGRNLYYPSADGNLKGFRAYFKISDPSVANAPIRYARFVVNQQEVATEIDENGNPKPSLRKEIENGTLVIIRDGIRYDVFGRKQ